MARRNEWDDHLEGGKWRGSGVLRTLPTSSYANSGQCSRPVSYDTYRKIQQYRTDAVDYEIGVLDPNQERRPDPAQVDKWRDVFHLKCLSILRRNRRKNR